MVVLHLNNWFYSKVCSGGSRKFILYIGEDHHRPQMECWGGLLYIYIAKFKGVVGPLVHLTSATGVYRMLLKGMACALKKTLKGEWDVLLNGMGHALKILLK